MNLVRWIPAILALACGASAAAEIGGTAVATAPLAETTALVKQLMDQKYESLIQSRLEAAGFLCNDDAIYYRQCHRGEGDHALHLQLHDIYDMQQERRTARVLLTQAPVACEGAGPLLAHWARQLRPLAPVYELAPPGARGTSPSPPNRRWAFESTPGPNAARYMLFLTLVDPAGDDKSCKAHVLLQSF